MVLALLVEAVLSMARYDPEPVKKVRERHRVQWKVDTERSKTIIKGSLRLLTVTGISEKRGRSRIVYSDWGPVSTEIFNTLHLESLHERDREHMLPVES